MFNSNVHHFKICMCRIFFFTFSIAKLNFAAGPRRGVLKRQLHENNFFFVQPTLELVVFVDPTSRIRVVVLWLHELS